jgi:two-component system, chemotaxis family, response regulator Rcp1
MGGGMHGSHQVPPHASAPATSQLQGRTCYLRGVQAGPVLATERWVPCPRGGCINVVVPGALMATKIQILLTEDNPADVRLLEEAINEQCLDCDLHVFDDGEEALKFAAVAGNDGQPPCPDIFLLDLHLPKIDGLDVLRRFRQNSNCLTTPVVIFSSSISPNDRREVARFAGTYFRPKPTGLDSFLTIGAFIKELLVLKAKAN